MITPLREVMKADYPTPITADNWPQEAEAAWSAIKDAIMSDPCLMRYDHRKLTVLRTDFSAIGFGYVACQPNNDEASLAAMHSCMSGNGFDDFLTKSAIAVLRPVSFGSRRCRNNESQLHSYLGEGFAGDWAINKCRHMCFGQPFVWATDCYAVKFILTYAGGNPAILRLQMRLMCWAMEIVHRADIFNVDADYWSRVGEDLCYDPMLRRYAELTSSLCSTYPPASDLPVQPENMPYYRGPRIRHNAATADADADIHLVQCMESDASMTYLGNVPVLHGVFPMRSSADRPQSRYLYNANISEAGWALSHFSWAVFGFNTGHFLSSILSRNMPFTIRYACDPLASGRALFAEFGNCDTVFGSAHELLHHIRSAGDTSFIHGYLIHSPLFATTDLTAQFWQTQAAIIAQLRVIHRLCLFVAFVDPRHDGKCVTGFKSTMKRAGWHITASPLAYPSFGDSVAGSTHIIVGVHSSTTPDAKPIDLRFPPSISPPPLSTYIWEPFNTVTYSISFTPDDAAFDGRMAITPFAEAPHSPTDAGSRVLYYAHRGHAEQQDTLAGSAIMDTAGLCPPLDNRPNTNVFRSLFGIEFTADGHRHIRPVSQFEVTSCFALRDNLRYRLSHPSNISHLDGGIPGLTSAWIFDQIYDVLLHIRQCNVDRFDPSDVDPPAGTSTSFAHSFLNGTIVTRLPDHARWVKETKDDEELSRIASMVTNPSLLTKANLSNVNYNYRHSLRNSLICIEDGLLIYREPLVGGSSYARLTIVPKSLRNIVFVAFHANPIGGHFNAARTFHRIRLRYFWPFMYKYIDRMCSACPGCALSNRVKAKSAELVYSFPIEAPFLVLHVDIYVAGKFAGFEGCTVFLIACCGMCSFACMEPVNTANAASFTSALMKIQLRFGLCHTVVLDKDSKFLGVFKESLELLKIHYHILSGENHNPMMVERINRYLNKGLKIMTNERGSVRVAMESILLLLYAWNSCPIPGTDISQSLVAVGREFSFPIDYSTNAHWNLTHSTPATVEKYSSELASRLQACREIAHLLVHEHRAMHRELIIDSRPSPRIFAVGDIVFARRAVRSDAGKERVDKLTYAYTGPWRITAVLSGGSYSLVHCQNEKRTQKKHASDLSPYPVQLLPMQPVDGPDSRFSQLYKEIIPNPFADAGVEGFTPPQPFQTGVSFARVGTSSDFMWPSLADFNAELCDDDWTAAYADQLVNEALVSYTGPPPAPPAAPDSAPTDAVPPTPSLVASIIASLDKLFFVAVKIGSGCDVSEWRLVRVALADSLALYPSCLQDCRFLVDFYILHPADVRFNAINQRYWIQYHPHQDGGSNAALDESHLIRPSESSEAYAKRHRLVPCCRYLNLSHTDTYICGPFDFATIKGRKCRDRIGREHWESLARHSSMFSNPVPSQDLPTYSIHVDHTFHFSVHGAPFPSSTTFG